jgi:UPF0716 protein FxsA
VFFKLLLLFTVVPVVELALLIKLSNITSIWTTVAVVIITGIVGAALTKSQGQGILRRIKVEISRGGIPGDELLNGAFVIVGGAMLLTPGLITDALGFILVMPFTRHFIKEWGKGKLRYLIETGRLTLFWR